MLKEGEAYMLEGEAISAFNRIYFIPMLEAHVNQCIPCQRIGYYNGCAYLNIWGSQY
jgi:hypothetical protein